MPSDHIHKAQELISVARKEKKVIRIRGYGSKDFLGLGRSDFIFDTTSYAGIVKYLPSELVIIAKAGTSVRAMIQVLAEENQDFPFETPLFYGQDATIGGAISCGLVGSGRLAQGPIRDHILGVEIVNGLGERLRFGGQVLKNVAGYDVSRIFVGSMGCLALVTEVAIRVIPKAELETTLAIAISSEEFLRQMEMWQEMRLPFYTVAYCPNECQLGCAYLLLKGTRAHVQNATATFSHLFQQQKFNFSILKDNQDISIWQALNQQSHFFFQPPATTQEALCRIVLPFGSPALPLDNPQLLEWSGCLRWVWIAPKDLEKLLPWLRTHGGTWRLWGDNQALQALFLPYRMSAQSYLQNKVQQSFDPDGVFNTGRLLLN
ncbi:MAG: glycolate oxidase subunit GlcE [Gammaproteobacteria bacterium]|nr:glycolate oxidase subunit GlcE [Gammaproteobacteria bacterium]